MLGGAGGFLIGIYIYLTPPEGVARRHPEATAHGIEPTLPAFP
ncbi:MAG TPA: hypothetical protein VIW78_07940 [Burkholderiales bacterium]